MTVRRERKDAVEHRRLILQTAQRLFEQHGVQSVSMHQIAKTAGIGQATLYRRYAHKGDLCGELLTDYSLSLIESISGYVRDNTVLPPVERLGGLIGLWIDALEEKADMIATMEARADCSPRGNFFHTDMYMTMRDLISGLLGEMIAEHDPPKAADTKLTAHALICSMSPPGYYHLKQEMGYSVEQIKQGYLEMCRLAVSPS